MEIRKLTEINGNGSYGVILPKDDLRDQGLINDNENVLEENQYLRIKPDEDGWSIELV